MWGSSSAQSSGGEAFQLPEETVTVGNELLSAFGPRTTVVTTFTRECVSAPAVKDQASGIAM